MRNSMDFKFHLYASNKHVDELWSKCTCISGINFNFFLKFKTSWFIQHSIVNKALPHINETTLNLNKVQSETFLNSLIPYIHKHHCLSSNRIPKVLLQRETLILLFLSCVTFEAATSFIKLVIVYPIPVIFPPN